jgi:hypothetical protein
MANTIERRIRFAAILMFVALFLEFGGIVWRHPLAFALVHMAALGLFALACAVYLLSLLPPRAH